MRFALTAVPAAMLLLMAVSMARADQTLIEAVEALKEGDGWRFDVTVLHADAGWEHYADRWQVVAPDGAVLGERVLLHPHDDEQPFTRSQGGIVIPEDVDHVLVRAHDIVHGWGKGLPFVLPR